MKPVDWLEHVHVAHASLIEDIDGLDDPTARGASMLPHWTRGHVLTHLARNADSNTGIFLAAQRGDVVPQYPGGAAQRERDIEAGANRPAAELVADVRDSAARLEAAWASTPDEVWDGGAGLSGARGRLSLPEWVFSRWRETEVHHSDLATGFTWARWSPEYVRLDLNLADEVLDLPEAAYQLVPNERLAWLLGRHWPDGLPEAPRWI